MLCELPSFEHIEVNSIQEAISWLHKLGEKATVIAGGTDLLGMMKDRIEGLELKIPEVLVNIKSIPAMNQIIHDEEIGLRIDAAVSLNRLETFDKGISKACFEVSLARGNTGISGEYWFLNSLPSYKSSLGGI